MPLSADAVSSSVLFNCLMLTTRVGHTCAHGCPHRENHRVWFTVIWLAKSCDHHSHFVCLRSVRYNMRKRWTSSLVVHCVAARTRQAAFLLTVGRQSFLAYMISGCHHCFCIERGTYQMIMQQATLHITFRAVCNVLHCSERMLWSQICTSLLPALECGMPLYLPYEFIVFIQFTYLVTATLSSGIIACIPCSLWAYRQKCFCNNQYTVNQGIEANAL